MLVLEVKEGESVAIRDANDKDVGTVKFIAIRQRKQKTVALGFVFDRSLKIHRETLFPSKDAHQCQLQP